MSDIQTSIALRTALTEAGTVLKAAGIDSYSLDSRILLEYITGKSREIIAGYPDSLLTDAEYQHFSTLLKRRAAREPVSHLTGKREFWGLEFMVTSDTLDPRPDSETIIEQALKFFPDKSRPLRILDLGTGTGCLLLSLLHEYPQATGMGIDISPPALAVAKANSIKLGLEKRVQFAVQCWAEGVGGIFDLIVSNPPYIKNNDVPLLQPEVSCYEPRIALEGGEDGLECYRIIAPDIARLLADDACVIFECGYGQEKQLSTILEQHNLACISYGIDLATIIRCVIAVKSKEK